MQEKDPAVKHIPLWRFLKFKEYPKLRIFPEKQFESNTWLLKAETNWFENIALQFITEPKWKSRKQEIFGIDEIIKLLEHGSHKEIN